MCKFNRMLGLGVSLFIITSASTAQEVRLELLQLVGLPSPYPATTYKNKTDAANSEFARSDMFRLVLPYRQLVEFTEMDLQGRARGGRRSETGWVVAERTPVITITDLRNCKLISKPSDEWTRVDCKLGADLRTKWGEWTETHINHYIGNAINGEIGDVAYIKERSDNLDIGFQGYFSKPTVILLSKALKQAKP